MVHRTIRKNSGLLLCEFDRQTDLVFNIANVYACTSTWSALVGKHGGQLMNVLSLANGHTSVKTQEPKHPKSNINYHALCFRGSTESEIHMKKTARDQTSSRKQMRMAPIERRQAMKIATIKTHPIPTTISKLTTQTLPCEGSSGIMGSSRLSGTLLSLLRPDPARVERGNRKLRP